MRIEIDYDRCAGTGMCTGFAPTVFEIADDGDLTVLIEEPPEDLRDAMFAAEAGCPMLAIKIHET